jgi:hypothetical protein
MVKNAHPKCKSSSATLPRFFRGPRPSREPLREKMMEQPDTFKVGMNSYRDVCVCAGVHAEDY